LDIQFAMLIRRVSNPSRPNKACPARASSARPTNVVTRPTPRPSLRRLFYTEQKQGKSSDASLSSDKGQEKGQTNDKSHDKGQGGDKGHAVTTADTSKRGVAQHRNRGRLMDPLDDWRDLSRRMDNFLTSSFFPTDIFADPFAAFPATSFAGSTLSEFQPSVDVSETDKSYHVHAELPGIPKENIHVSIRNGMLEISGNKDFKKETKDEKRNWTRVERSYGSFVRRIAVPRELDASKIKAKYDNGVLELEVPKPEPTQQDQFQVKIE